MNKYLILEFVLIIITRANLFRQFAKAANACHCIDDDPPMTIILGFPEAICVSRLERNNVYFMYTCTALQICYIKGIYS